METKTEVELALEARSLMAAKLGVTEDTVIEEVRNRIGKCADPNAKVVQDLCSLVEDFPYETRKRCLNTIGFVVCENLNSLCENAEEATAT